MTRIDDARNDYLAGMKYKEIAQKYGVALSTVKSWKTRYGWQRGQKGMHTKEKSTRTKAPPEVVEELAENDELNDNQKRFCLYYLQRYNATWAYQQAYESSYQVAKVNAWKLMQKPKIKEQLDKLKRQQVQDLYVTANDIVREYLHQATADITDVLDFRTEKRLVCKRLKMILVRMKTTVVTTAWSQRLIQQPASKPTTTNPSWCSRIAKRLTLRPSRVSGLIKVNQS